MALGRGGGRRDGAAGVCPAVDVDAEAVAIEEAWRAWIAYAGESNDDDLGEMGG